MLSFNEYVDTLTRLGALTDPLAVTQDSVRLRAHAAELAALPDFTPAALAGWIQQTPEGASTLALTVGLSAEKFKNNLRHHFGTSGYVTLARRRPHDLIDWMIAEYDVASMLRAQVHQRYGFGDILVARGGSKVTAGHAGQAGRSLEDAIENVAQGLGLTYRTRTRFKGTGGREAPADLLVLKDDEPVIAVAAKGFDSTGSKLSDAVRVIDEMASVRTPRMFVMAAIDGIGWKSRQSDLRKIYALREIDSIDGIYTLALMDDFQADLTDAARRLGLFP